MPTGISASVVGFLQPLWATVPVDHNVETLITNQLSVHAQVLISRNSSLA